jgi:hypothetical protein
VADADSYQRQIDKLHRVADRLEAGDAVQLTALLPIQGLVEHSNSESQFLVYLLGEIKNNPSQPVNPAPPMPVAEKQVLLDRLQALIAEEILLDKFHRRLILDSLNQYTAGHKRISVHASRYKVADADVALISALFRCFRRYPYDQELIYALYDLKYWAYKASQFYCCDYKSYRLIPQPTDAWRVRNLAQFFEKERPQDQINRGQQ